MSKQRVYNEANVPKTKFKCAVGGKLTAGRVPRRGDGTFRYPRMHIVNGKICDGVFREAEWV